MSDFFGFEIGLTQGWILFVIAGAALVGVAKLFGYVFMSGPSKFRVGEAMKNARAEVSDWRGDEGFVSADGELWKAVSRDNLQPGDPVQVVSVDGLVLTVKRKQRH